MPIRVVITQGTTADCTQASRLIEGITAEYLLADRGYDSDAIVEQAGVKGMNPVIPPRRNRKTQRDYDPELYRLRHIVEVHFYSQTMARYHHALCQNFSILPCRHSNLMYRSLG